VTVAVRELDPTAYLSLKHDQLLSQRWHSLASSRYLGLKSEAARFNNRKISAAIAPDIHQIKGRGFRHTQRSPAARASFDLLVGERQ
jgi:hypothetical protein